MDGWMKGWLGFSTVKQRDLTCKHPPGYWLLHAWSQRKLITVKRVLTWKAPPPSYFDGIEDDIAMKSKIPSFKEISWKPSSASEWAKTYRGWGGKKKTSGNQGYRRICVMYYYGVITNTPSEREEMGVGGGDLPEPLSISLVEDTTSYNEPVSSSTVSFVSS